MPIFRKKRLLERILDNRRGLLFQRQTDAEAAPAPPVPGAPPTPEEEEEMPKVAREFRRGLAEELGVPPEAISPDLVEKWYSGWTKAILKPEYWKKATSSPPAYQIQQLGRQLGRVVKDGMQKKSKEPIEEYARKMAETTGMSVQEVKESKPFKRYKETFE